MIVWREKLVATAIHFLATLVLAAAAAALIFLVWFPDPFQTMVGGTELFVLVVGCDLALGPLMSLVVYNSRKTRRSLLIDYSIVGVIQIGALVYGVVVVAGSRPAYVAFNADRFEVVTAREIAGVELAAAHDPLYASLPWTGPRYVGIEVPKAEQGEAMLEDAIGNKEYQRPRFYVPFESQLPLMKQRAKPLADLLEKRPQSQELLEDALRGVEQPRERLAWLPVHHAKGFWTAIVDVEDCRPVAYLDFDPY